jgi:hypothetical protein
MTIIVQRNDESFRWTTQASYQFLETKPLSLPKAPIRAGPQGESPRSKSDDGTILRLASCPVLASGYPWHAPPSPCCT